MEIDNKNDEETMMDIDDFYIDLDQVISMLNKDQPVNFKAYLASIDHLEDDEGGYLNILWKNKDGRNS